MITIKSRREFSKMQKAGATVAAVLSEVRHAAEPGVSLVDLDRLAQGIIEERGCTPSFLGYQPPGQVPFPGCLCLSVNDVIVHGIPGEQVLREGDILSVDAGAIFEGFHGDAAFTMPIGEVDDASSRLIEVTEKALWAGIEMVHKGAHVGDIGAAVSAVGREAGYGIVEEYVGHGIGRRMHEEPQVPNYGTAGKGLRLRTGMAICIEPMFNVGSRATKVDPDGWTVRTADGSRSAHFEHTICLTPDGAQVFTAAETPVPVQFEESAHLG